MRAVSYTHLGGQTNLIPPAEESPSPHKSRGNTTAHKNFQRFQKLFPEIVSGQYESLRLEAGDAYDPLVIHHKYGDHYCMEHYYMQNGDRMYDPYMDFLIDRETGTLRAFSYENSGIGVYQEADPADPAQEKKIAGFGQFFATWLNNIASQDYEPVRATMPVSYTHLHQRRPRKVQSGAHTSTKQPVAGCFALRLVYPARPSSAI